MYVLSTEFIRAQHRICPLIATMSFSLPLTVEEEKECDYYEKTFTSMLKSEMASMVRALDVDGDENDDGQEKYTCLRGCRISLAGSRGYVVSYTSSVGKPLKRMQKVILSRTNPMEDAYKEKAKVVFANQDEIVLHPRWKPPADLEVGELRIDEASSEELVQSMIYYMHHFVKEGNSLFRKLNCCPTHGEERSKINEMHNLEPHVIEYIELCCKSHELNSAQTEAIFAAVDHRLTLCQGPPGTGKTQMACTFLQIASNLDEKCLVTAHSNRAVDGIAFRLKDVLADECLLRGGDVYALSAELQPYSLQQSIADHCGRGKTKKARDARKAFREEKVRNATILMNTLSSGFDFFVQKTVK